MLVLETRRVPFNQQTKKCVFLSIIQEFILVLFKFIEVFVHVFLKTLDLFDDVYNCSFKFCTLRFVLGNYD